MNECLHCALLEAAQEWGTKFGSGIEDNGRFITVEDLLGALSHCVGETIGANIPPENLSARVNRILRHMEEVGAAIGNVDRHDAATVPANNN